MRKVVVVHLWTYDLHRCAYLKRIFTIEFRRDNFKRLFGLLQHSRYNDHRPLLCTSLIPFRSLIIVILLFFFFPLTFFSVSRHFLFFSSATRRSYTYRIDDPSFSLPLASRWILCIMNRPLWRALARAWKKKKKKKKEKTSVFFNVAPHYNNA